MLAIIIATLHPSNGHSAPATCLFCGERWLADALANVALFLPFGAALSLGRLPMPRIVVIGCLCSALVEATQIAIPGRDANITDVIANTAGTWLGAVAFPSARRATAPRHVALITVIPGIPAAAFAITAALTRPAPPEGTLYGQWTPNLAQLEWYRGRVLHAALGTIAIEVGRLDGQDAIRAAVNRGEPVIVGAIAGPAPRREATLFAVANDLGNHVFRLGPDGTDLVVYRRLVAASFGLDEPYVRFPEVLRETAPGDTLRVVATPTDTGIALAVGERAQYSGITLGEGWMLIYSAPAANTIVRRILSVMWVAALLIPVGYAAGRRPKASWGIVAAFAALLVIPDSTWLAPSPPVEWAAATVGCLMGFGLRSVPSAASGVAGSGLQSREQSRHQ